MRIATGDMPSDLYTALRVSPRKKRVYNSDDEDVLTPKKLRER